MIIINMLLLLKIYFCLKSNLTVPMRYKNTDLLKTVTVDKTQKITKMH